MEGSVGHRVCYLETATRGEPRERSAPRNLQVRHLQPPKSGNEANLRRALATSNNQCFARWAVDRVGADGMQRAIERFGLLRSPAFGHGAGRTQIPSDDALGLGRVGSGLAGLQITPLHAAQLAGVLAHGRRVEPHWIAGEGGGADAEVLSPPLARQLRRAAGS